MDEKTKTLETLKLYGYYEPISPLVLNEQDLERQNDLSCLGVQNRHLLLDSISKREIIKTAKSFMYYHFKLHKVPFKRLLAPLDYVFLSRLPNVSLATHLCNGTCININPFMIPVKYRNNPGNDNILVANGAILFCEEFYQKMKIYYQSIILDKEINELSPSAYIHEITHTELTRETGINGHYFYEEVLPIFLEIVSIYETGSNYLLEAESIIRLSDLLYQLGNLEKYKNNDPSISFTFALECSKYASSIVIAYGLFIEYLNGSISLRKYIMRCIQNIFDGSMPLTELLDEFELDFHDTLNSKKLIKYFEEPVIIK